MTESVKIHRTEVNVTPTFDWTAIYTERAVVNREQLTPAVNMSSLKEINAETAVF